MLADKTPPPLPKLSKSKHPSNLKDSLKLMAVKNSKKKSLEDKGSSEGGGSHVSEIDMPVQAQPTNAKRRRNVLLQKWQVLARCPD